MTIQPPGALAIPLLCTLALQGCGTDPGSDAGSETNSTTAASTGTETGDMMTTGDMTTGDMTTTGDGDGDGDGGLDACGCSSDEICVAHADDFCGAGFGYSTSCEPIAACDGDCSCETVCGDFCVPACDYSAPDIDFWCDGWFIPSCNLLLQDCPEGEKCVPYSNNGTNYNDSKCVSILGQQAPGEPCEFGGVVDATDDCDGDGYCFPSVGEQLCQPFCTAEADCEQPGYECAMLNSGILTMCLATCDPLAGDPCPDGGSCSATGQVTEAPFTCTPGDGAQKAQTEPCSFLDDCAEGLICADQVLVDGCGAGSCCTALCLLDDPNACLGLEPMTCRSIFELDPAPAGFEQHGACVVP